MKYWALVALSSLMLLPTADAGQPIEDSQSNAAVFVITKEQLAVVRVALREAHKINLDLRGQQARLEDRGDVVRICFLADPVNLEVVGSEGGIIWEIRKRDAKVVRVIHDR